MRQKILSKRPIRYVAIALVLAISLVPISTSPAAAQSVGDYFQISYEPVSFVDANGNPKTEVHGDEVFYATIKGKATCIEDLPVSVSEASITSRAVAEHQVSGILETLNPSYSITIEPFPYRKGDTTEINEVIPLQFPEESEPGDYNVIGELIEAKVRVKFVVWIWQDVTSYLPQSQLMGSVAYITPEEEPTIAYTPKSFSFSATHGEANLPDQTLSIWNSGGGTLSWSVSDNATWLKLSPTSGKSTGEVDSVTLSVNISDMSSGTYNATITVSAPGATNTPRSVGVSLIIASPAISFSPSSFSFNALEDGLNPPDQTLSIWNSGGGTLSWSASDNATWLKLSPNSGSSTGEVDSVTLSVNISDMSSGTYNATITVSAPGATDTPQSVGVSLRIAKLPPEQVIHIASIDMSLTTRWYGLLAHATATVRIVDNQSNPVEDVKISGQWSDATRDNDSGVTNSEGKVTLSSDTVWRATSGTRFTFTVDDVSKNGWTYNPAANMESSDSKIVGSESFFSRILSLLKGIIRRASLILFSSIETIKGERLKWIS